MTPAIDQAIRRLAREGYGWEDIAVRLGMRDGYRTVRPIVLGLEIPAMT